MLVILQPLIRIPKRKENQLGYANFKFNYQTALTPLSGDLLIHLI